MRTLLAAGELHVGYIYMPLVAGMKIFWSRAKQSEDVFIRLWLLKSRQSGCGQSISKMYVYILGCCEKIAQHEKG